LLEVKDGEKFFLGGKGEEGGECQEKCKDFNPKEAASAKLKRMAEMQKFQEVPLLKLFVDVAWKK
jgi:hypothetical protein